MDFRGISRAGFRYFRFSSFTFDFCLHPLPLFVIIYGRFSVVSGFPHSLLISVLIHCFTPSFFVVVVIERCYFIHVLNINFHAWFSYVLLRLSLLFSDFYYRSVHHFTLLFLFSQVLNVNFKGISLTLLLSYFRFSSQFHISAFMQGTTSLCPFPRTFLSITDALNVNLKREFHGWFFSVSLFLIRLRFSLSLLHCFPLHNTSLQLMS